MCTVESKAFVDSAQALDDNHEDIYFDYGANNIPVGRHIPGSVSRQRPQLNGDPFSTVVDVQVTAASGW